MPLLQATSSKNTLVLLLLLLLLLLLETMGFSQGHPYEHYYHVNWPANPFHPGEVSLQQHANVHKSVMSYAPRVIRPYLPEQHLDFYQHQPFLVAAALDSNGFMWSTLLTSPTGQADWVKAVVAATTNKDASNDGNHTNEKKEEVQEEEADLTKLVLEGGPVPGDALYGAFQEGSDVGLLGIEFATKRRNRVNGRIVYRSSSTTTTTASSNKHNSTNMVFQVDQAFGNCPQYIKPRQWWSQTAVDDETTTLFQNAAESRDKGDDVCASPLEQQKQENQQVLTPQHVETISNAETIFVATGYRGEGEDVRYGNDASHRGGPPGFVMVQDDHRTLVLPDFAGNNHFNTLGNLEMDPRMGITVPDFEGGGLLQLSGHAKVDLDSHRAAETYPGALRLITFHIQQIHVVPPKSLPIRWSSSDADQERPLEITSIVQESENVKSFYLRRLPQDKRPLWTFQAGQHLPIRLLPGSGGEIWRTYSLSGPPSSSADYYRISVKREFLGLGSRILHDEMQEGDVVEVQAPAGDFILKPSSMTKKKPNDNTSKIEDKRKTRPSDALNATKSDPPRPLVLLSAGIGMTPLLAMLHDFVRTSTINTASRQRVVWIHGARDGDHHPMKKEVQELQQQQQGAGLSMIETHIRYSRPRSTDTDFDSQGRLDAALLRSILPQKEELEDADYYFCGPGSFTSDMEQTLQTLGVNSRQIHFESF
jgi:ferredoxin-NADP reductase/predicted pyridoxine 5'-phosphate oxidase superfamily flavin-nucleotide-binding protein